MDRNGTSASLGNGSGPSWKSLPGIQSIQDGNNRSTGTSVGSKKSESWFATRSADNGTPFFENRFLFGTVLDDFSF